MKAKSHIDSNFLLLMADHVFQHETARALMGQRLAPGEVILAVDRRINGVFDLDDATKVRCDGNLIVEIGKNLASYNALDTGMFLCSPALFDELEAVRSNGDCSLSDGMRELAGHRKLRAWQIGDSQWHDLDTPEALAHAELVFAEPVSPEVFGGAWLMSKSLPVRSASAVLGILLLVYLVCHTGPANLWENVRTLGWGLGLIVALGGLAHIVKTVAWRLTLLDERRQVSFAKLFGLRLASEAAGQLGVLGQAFGETLRVSFLNSTIPLASRIRSVALDRVLFIVSGALVTVSGLTVLPGVAPLPHKLAICAEVFLVAFLAALILAGVAAWNRWEVLSGAARLLRFDRPIIASVERELLDFCHRAPTAFCMSFGLNIICQFLAVLEVYLTLRLMGFHISILQALAAEAMTKLINMMGALTPGNVGLYEGGNMLIARLFGLSAVAGLTVALARRFRALFWAIIGGLWFFVLSKSGTLGLPKAENQRLPGAHDHVAIILGNNAQGYTRFGAPLPHVGALSVLLRAVLLARKAGASRIIVATGRLSAPGLKRDLLGTGRVPDGVEWIEPEPGEAAISSLLGRLSDMERRRLAIIDGETVYHPSLYRLLAEWNGPDGVLEVTDGERPVGLYALSSEVTADLANRVPPGIENLLELHTWLNSTYRIEGKPIEADHWQPVLNSEHRILAEKKLDSWIIKSTDGRFARLNRKVSIPISRELLRFPITPNMVSLFTLGVGLLSGVFFALGGYWNMLSGAALSLLASMLDGCDGEIARLKLLESDFGCWLDTLCDYLSYLFLYAGIAIGLARTSGNKVYLGLCILLFFGAILVFTISGLQRRQLTNGRPEKLLEIWQKKAESRRSNPLLYVARHTEFLMRRCFLPYAIVCFAALNILNVAFILSVVGVNVAWILALYSYWTFAPAKQARTAATPVTA